MLAERSQVAAQEIGSLANSSVQVAEKAGTLLGEMVPTIQKTADLVQEIAAASGEQTMGVTQISTAMHQLSQTTQHNASSSEELAATAEEMSQQAQQLQQLMAFFTVSPPVADATSAPVPPMSRRPPDTPKSGTTWAAGPTMRARTNGVGAPAGPEADESDFVRF